ncbi:MAG: hypothetical protein GVY28_09955 [Alphaproteobacteria bacterium]|jgi:cholesterol transport system auxiliary component|nr:hypothetical protein [Alphaproteobacteria bacterium]
MTRSPAGRRRFLVSASAAALAGATGLAGCAALPGLSEPPDLYTLTPKSTFPPDLPPVDWQLLVEPAVASAALDTVRIALRRELTRIEYYAGVAWTERAPLMVQTLLVESFENSGAIVSVGRETFGLRADYVLKTELREFQAEYLDDRAAPKVRAQINAKLVRMPDRQIVVGQTFEALLPADSRAFGDVILAFDAALGEVLKDAVEWAIREGERDWQAR